MTLIYKCRMCGAAVEEKFPDVESLGDLLMAEAVNGGVSVHECESGKFGVMDLRGGKE